MNSSIARLGLAAAAVVGAVVASGPATAYVGGPTVLFTGSQGPVLGCPHTVAASVPNQDWAATQILDDGVPITPVQADTRPEAGPSGVRTTWVPDRLGWHTLEVVYAPADGPEERTRLDIEVWRVGVNAGSSCIANGVPLPIDPNTGGLAMFR
ncbi:hypothetical protein F5X71_07820 [Nocardia brasiliensis]|uniref:Secreted protein n=1 Tax=Nocardia brasiliensis TaxID=37326 RepID=A0A6G9XMT9_NOCBR|nr:hypothetical protein [Nocardia brasiliensis]QIS02235.1 hypothetical protein F5X71_07820 [Nocardia brasiliensis]